MPNRPRTLGLGVWLARRGALVGVGLLLAAIGAVVASVAAFALRRSVQDGPGAAVALLNVTSSSVAWGAGITLAFGAALRALERDRDEGVLGLARTRGATAGEYVRGRVLGVVAVLTVAVGGATLVAALAAVSAFGPAARLMRAAVGALAYALAFAGSLGPLAVATLGGRSRTGGYLAFLAVLVLPEVLAPATAPLLPGDGELTSIPAALSAVRSGVAAPTANAPALARALVALVAVAALSMAVTAARVRGTQQGPST
jgi:hypothetical protein